MKTVQITIDESLLAEVDEAVKALNTTRSAFVRQVLNLALQHYKISQLERKHADGYAKHPVETGEFGLWQDEQAWEQA